MSLEASLAKQPQTDGSRVALGNGESWLIPSINFMPLRPVFSLDADGLPVVVDVARPAKLAALTRMMGELFDEVAAQGGGTSLELDWDKAFRAAYMLLEINYGITPDVVNAAELITQATVLPILNAGFGEKKKAKAAPSGQSQPA